MYLGRAEAAHGSGSVLNTYLSETSTRLATSLSGCGEWEKRQSPGGHVGTALVVARGDHQLVVGVSVCYTVTVCVDGTYSVDPRIESSTPHHRVFNYSPVSPSPVQT